MTKYKRLLIVESNERLGQFLTDNIEEIGEDISVKEIDPNSVPDDVLQSR